MLRENSKDTIYTTNMQSTIVTTLECTIKSDLSPMPKKVTVVPGKMYVIIYRDEIDKLTKELFSVDEIVKDGTYNVNKSYLICTGFTPDSGQIKSRQVIKTIPISNIHDISNYTVDPAPVPRSVEDRGMEI